MWLSRPCDNPLQCFGVIRGIKCPAARMHASGRGAEAAVKEIENKVERRYAAQQPPEDTSSCYSRREIMPLGIFVASLCSSLAIESLHPEKAEALGFKKELKKRKRTLDEYSEGSDGLKYLDLVIGKGKTVTPGSKVTVHFDCMYRGLDVVSSRNARLLGANRTIAEPFEFVAGEPVKVSVKKVNDSAGGLFAGTSGPKPPPALATSVVGMKVGGKVRTQL